MQTEPKPVWNNLKDGRCPKDGKYLEFKALDGIYQCTNKACDFSIREAKFDELINKMYGNVPKKQEQADGFQRFEL